MNCGCIACGPYAIFGEWYGGKAELISDMFNGAERVPWLPD